MTKAPAELERLVVIVKPEGIKNNIVEQVRTELKNLSLGFLAISTYNFFDHPEMAKELYANIKHKTYYPDPVLAIQRRPQPVYVIFTNGVNAVEIVRNWLGPTDVDEAINYYQNTFRGRMLMKYGKESGYFEKAANFVHVSSSVEDGEREGRLFFPSFYS
jgi:nucleoside diphosphate kinase